MDQKKKSLSAVWNQLDKPPVRNPSSAILNTLLSSRIGEEVRKNTGVEQSTKPKLTSQNYNTGCKSYISEETFEATSSRYSNCTALKMNLKTENATTDCKSLSSQKFSNASKSKFSRFNKNQGLLHLEDANIGLKNRVHGPSKATHSKSSTYSKSRDNLLTQDISIKNEDNDLQRLSAVHKERNDIKNGNICGKNYASASKRNSNSQNYEVMQHKSKHFQERSEKHWERRDKPISFTALKELITKEPNEILLKICHKNSPFMLRLNEKDIRVDMMALILIALGEVCTTNLIQTLSTFLNMVRGNDEFFCIAISKFLVALRPNTMQDYHRESLLHLTVFLQKLQHTLASSSSDLISMLLPLILTKCESLLQRHGSLVHVMSKLKEIKDENEYFINHHTQSEIKKASKWETQQLIEPPENFRSLPVLPTVDDIYSHAFLRPNVVEGKYIDSEHYLDVQYRLLREDYVKPLRDGIGDYLRLKEVGKSVKTCKDVRVYENVYIVKQDFVNGSMLHIAQLTVDKEFSRIKWEYSKRFLSGSLLCLSSDNFKSMLFASVARRIPEQLKKGLLLLRFEKITDEVLNISPFTNFVILETSAYFEACRYNLKALCELNEEALPLKKYIVDVDSTVNPPDYLNDLTTYDMRPLLLPLDSTHIKRIETIDGDIKFQYEFPANISGVSKSVEILKDSSWPSCLDLNLDNSQYLALKSAVTREFSVIQGPPGTGKTYIGLRIVQLLLHNIDKWLTTKENILPILVVCYTNHALDQFLEGMMHFTDKIVRIGGRGSNETVSEFQLSNLRQSLVRKKGIPFYLNNSLFHQNMLLKNTKSDIDNASRLVGKCLKRVLGEKELKKYIPDSHYVSLKSVVNSPDFKELNLNDDDFIIYDWLGIRCRFEGINFEVPSEIKEEINVAGGSEAESLEVDDAEAESMDEGDVEFIEAQRDIDGEDFADVSFDIEDPEKDEMLPPDDSGWQHQGGQKQRLKYIKKCLNSSKPLEESVALKIRDIWKLKMPERWDLYKFWLEKMVIEKQQECMKLQEKLKAQYEELLERRNERDIFVLQKAQVIGMTTTGAAKYRHIVQRLNPQILIVEEAAEILESHIVTSLAPNTKHIILIGDHQQLRPSPTVYMLAVKYNLNISLFERMINNKMECFRLSMQHRMRPDITDLIVPHIYKELENHESVFKYENIKGVSKNVFFITHNYIELHENESKSKLNEHEAKFLVKLCNYFIQQGYSASQITVLTTYSGQLKLMKKERNKKELISNVRFTVVDNYQGEENDIILISFVRSNDDGEIGFLKIANRVCVALSRAKKGLFCIGNFELLAEISNLWENITKTLHEKKAIGPSLQLMCQNHPEVCSVVATEKDFESVPEGGCTKICGFRLSCGHVCSLMCHPYDRMHENVRCYKKCNKTCKEGHECRRKCFEDCGLCEHLVPKKIFPCEHTIEIPCHEQDLAVECNAPCDKNLLCGHKCPKKCSENCAEFCRKKIRIKSPVCDHTVTVECRHKNCSEELMKNCRNLCNTILDCGHRCKGNCYKCHQGRLHVICNQPCKRILVCGHECKSPCAKSCPPCKFPCENKCIHSRCPKECGEPCDVCTEECEWQCQHKKCSLLCGEICNRVPCNEPCLKELQCGHLCIGYCGEPCPNRCRNCDSEVVKEIFFGTEEDDDARFVQLEDCNHILEISGLNEWLTEQQKGDHQIQMKSCPKCKTIIRTNLRYGNIIKGCLKKIEIVKQKTYGNVENNMYLQNQVLQCLEANASILLNLKSGSLYEFWKKILLAKKRRSIQEITTMENIVKITLQWAEVRFSITSYGNQVPLIKEGLEVLSSFVESAEIWLFDFVRDEIFTASEQQLQQLSWEIHRLKLSYKLLKFTKKYVIKVPAPEFENCIALLTNFSSFGENSVKQFLDFFKALARKTESAVINVSEMEKQSILKAMNLSVGHWYQCPNGHVYCITECGGAMEVSRCNECKATIGGTNHTLLANNAVATAMDGARYSAWSDEMNMNNYDIDYDYD